MTPSYPSNVQVNAVIRALPRGVTITEYPDASADTPLVHAIRAALEAKPIREPREAAIQAARDCLVSWYFDGPPSETHHPWQGHPDTTELREALEAYDRVMGRGCETCRTSYSLAEVKAAQQQAWIEADMGYTVAAPQAQAFGDAVIRNLCCGPLE